MRQSDRKKLWGLARGMCSLCKRPHSEVELEEAHIFAREAGGPRADPHMLPRDLNAYENLILLCPNCHSTVDGDINAWTVERLKREKAAHEEYVRHLDEGTVSELAGEITVRAQNADDVAGARIRKPTRIKSGTKVIVDASDAKRVTGIDIGGEK